MRLTPINWRFSDHNLSDKVREICCSFAVGDAATANLLCPGEVKISSGTGINSYEVNSTDVTFDVQTRDADCGYAVSCGQCLLRTLPWCPNRLFV